MANEQCPLCSGPLEVREASPCHECGGDPASLQRFQAGQHTYYAVRVLQGQELILCDSCMVSFGSFDPDFFGWPKGALIGFENMEILRQIQGPSARSDMYCPSCSYRLRFLRFVRDSRNSASA
ncbi:MAG: hypothetical protein ACT4OM_01670 [Actinomycetota bacterium]